MQPESWQSGTPDSLDPRTFGQAMTEAIHALTVTPVAPGELRVGVVTLGPLLERTTRTAVEGVYETNGRVEQRWRLHAAGLTTDWLAVE